MSSEFAAHTIAGGWLGTYYYASGHQEPVRFEATFSLTGRDGSFGGRILDDNYLGEATISKGLQAGREIVFTKVYIQLAGGRTRTPIFYEGTMSEDGRTLHGKWMFEYGNRSSLRMSSPGGTWDAHRLWTEQAEAVHEQAPEAMRYELTPIGGR